MTTAFVLGGGAGLGAVEVGMLYALTERGIRPDLLIGTSAGALNAAYVAGRGTGLPALDELAAIWRNLRRQDVFPLDPVRQLLAVTGLRSSLCSDRNLRQLIESHLPYRDLEDASIPVHLVATDLLTGREVLLSTGEAVSAVLASAAVPGVLPALQREGLSLVDGGIADDAALSQAVALGADDVWVLPAGYACALPRPPTTALATAVQALTLLTHQRLLLEVADFSERVELHVLPPLCPVSVSPIDFSHAGELIERAHRATQAWIAAGGDRRPHPERILSLHNHRPRLGEPDASSGRIPGRGSDPTRPEDGYTTVAAWGRVWPSQGRGTRSP
ncbi:MULTISPECIES: patatin-like phospholipase family protein [Rhodococcus]|uniref:Patatin-like phospholipase family protein n=1 Tax=Rhodococcus rhodochrous TaxID=1829 RepID=A0AAW4XK10_RHORH|nr:patatin-like phospholipase family protein [Rhodococcus rhodochrous]MCD2113376.1 patatin-like phospholipase family protein [Rhodococcus rhodochrous]QHG83456.1 patatin-like phospholipase family protein [Rhodococcus rhodochrous]QOH56863.1 alpha/beta hydrolase [Rhodococcus rhodochrous]